jgi:hypothetical protein
MEQIRVPADGVVQWVADAIKGYEREEKTTS